MHGRITRRAAAAAAAAVLLLAAPVSAQDDRETAPTAERGDGPGQPVDEDRVNTEPPASEEHGTDEDAAGTAPGDDVLEDGAAIDSRPEVDRPDAEEIIPGGIIGGETDAPGAGGATGTDREVFPGDAPSSQGGATGD